MNQALHPRAGGKVRSFRLSLRRKAKHRLQPLQEDAPPPKFGAGTARVALAYLAAALFVAILFVPRVFAAEEAALAFQLAFWVILALTLYRSVGSVLLIVTLAYLLWREPRGLLERDGVQVAMLSGLSLALTLLLSRFRTHMDLLELNGIPGIRTLWQRAWPALSGTQAGPYGGDSTRRNPLDEATRRGGRGTDSSCEIDEPSSWWIELAWIPLSLAASLILAWLVLSLVPLDLSSKRVLGLIPTGLRTIQLAFLVSITFWVVQVFVRELAWRQATPAQARLYLRGVTVAWMHRDIAWLVRGRRKLQKRSAKIRSR